MTWIAENKDLIVLALWVLLFVAMIVIRLTPTKRDDEVFDRFMTILKGIETDDIELKIVPKKKVDNKPSGDED